MTLYLLLALGGALGTVARFSLNGWVSNLSGGTFPWGTLVINVAGSFAIGFFATLTEPGGRVYASPASRQFFMVGICGGFTTFSAFSLQTLNLARGGEWLKAGANVISSVACCLVAVWIGHLAAAYFNQLKGR
jgi:fluoride exporter